MDVLTFPMALCMALFHSQARRHMIIYFLYSLKEFQFPFVKNIFMGYIHFSLILIRTHAFQLFNLYIGPFLLQK